VLIVDDEEDIRALLRALLDAAPDLDVVAEAVDGPDALAMVEALHAPPVPHVIVLDNKMPGMSGTEVARHIVEHVPGQRIVLFTAFDDSKVRREATAAGIAAVVPKSDVDRLVPLLREL
jgi:DNA-binding NarL/FixJ family response regulator